MTWLDVITPISKTLIPDDERRQDVNRGILRYYSLSFSSTGFSRIWQGFLMHRAGTNLNQVAKAINAIKYRFKLGFEGEEEYRQAVYMTGYAAEKLSWRSKDVHEVAMKILCEYLPEDEAED